MTTKAWLLAWGLGMLLAAGQARADDAVPLGPLTAGGAKFGLVGVLGGGALSLSGMALGARFGTGEFSGLTGTAVGVVATAVGLPFLIATGVSRSAAERGYDVSYGRGLGGAFLGGASYGLFLLPSRSHWRGLAMASLILGGLVTTFVTAPLMSAWMVRRET